MKVWVFHSSLSQSQQVSIRSDYVGEAIKEAELLFSFDEPIYDEPQALSAKFDGRTLGRDSSVPITTSQKPLVLFEGIFEM